MEVAYIWFIASVLFFFLEMIGISGIGLLFAAIGAFCVGLTIELGFIGSTDYLAQGVIFCAFTALFALVLWKPLKKLRGSDQRHHDMVGRTAKAASGGLSKGKTGRAKWSGTTMRARLAEDANISDAAEGDELKIVKVDGSTLILAQMDYPIKNHGDEDNAA